LIISAIYAIEEIPPSENWLNGPVSFEGSPRIECRPRGKTSGLPIAIMLQSSYFFAPEPLPGFKTDVDPAAGFGFSALGFFGSRLLLFWPLAMIVSWAGKSAILAPLSLYTLTCPNTIDQMPPLTWSAALFIFRPRASKAQSCASMTAISDGHQLAQSRKRSHARRPH
jgi:hypothetical protein